MEGFKHNQKQNELHNELLCPNHSVMWIINLHLILSYQYPFILLPVILKQFSDII